MKSFKFFKINLLLLAFCTALFGACSGSKTVAVTENSMALQNAFRNNHWIFVPSTVSPQSGAPSIVNGSYDVRASNQLLQSALPYIGRGFNITGYRSNNMSPLNFDSEQPKYTTKDNGKGLWTVTVVLSDQKDIKNMIFSFYENGQASLLVNLNNRTSMRYNGTVAVRK